MLPEGWVARIRRPTPPAPNGRYGAHWWLNAGTPGAPADRPFPSLPTDLFYASGYEGQFVVVLPSRDLVVVRLGQSEPEQAFDLEGFLVACSRRRDLLPVASDLMRRRCQCGMTAAPDPRD